MIKSRFFFAGLCFVSAGLIQIALASSKKAWPNAIVAMFDLAAATAFFARAYWAKTHPRALQRDRGSYFRVG
jgi:hypothetical protein